MVLSEVRLIADKGKGRPFIVLYEGPVYEKFAGQLLCDLSEKTRTVLLECSPITDSNWSALTVTLRDLMQSNGMRQASFVTFGAAGSLVQNLALLDLKMVRTFVLVDASTRPHPSLFTKALDRIERSLPLGLPFRHDFRGFDSKPFLQRIRCPTLVVTSSRATHHEQEEAKVMLANLPTAWSVTVGQEDEVPALTSLVMAFQEVPAKCPQ